MKFTLTLTLALVATCLFACQMSPRHVIIDSMPLKSMPVDTTHGCSILENRSIQDDQLRINFITNCDGSIYEIDTMVINNLHKYKHMHFHITFTK